MDLGDARSREAGVAPHDPRVGGETVNVVDRQASVVDRSESGFDGEV